MKRVIVVDDNELSVQGIVANIDWNALGAQVTSTANDGFTAMREIEADTPDLIISDIDMPGMDGIEMCQQALALAPQVKILLISAYDKFDYAKRAIRIGVFDYIEKPINYEYLTNKIRNAFSVIDEEANNRRLVEESRPVIMQKFFEDLVHYPGTNAEEELGRYVEYLQLQTDYYYYNAVKFEIINARDVESAYGVVRYQMEMLRLSNGIERTASMFDWHYSYSKYNEIICCIGQNTRNIRHLLTVIQKFADDVYQLSTDMLVDINVGIGVIQSRFWDLHLAYENASNALKYRFCFPHDNIYDANDTERHSFSLTAAADQSDAEILRLIGTGTPEQIDAWLADYFRKMLETTPMKSVVFTRVYSLVGKILQFLYETNIDSADLEPEIASLYSNIESYHSYQELHQWMFEFCRRVRHKMNFSTESYHTQICNQVRAFIDLNYSDNNLSLSDLSKTIGISSAYLSALYKKVTGQNINDTITDCRIKRACHLLKETELPLKEISTQCGYSNQYYFSSAFKKKLGMSPSAYRGQ